MLDMLMKGMYGLEVLEKLREMDADARVIIVTADIQNSTHELAERGGAIAFLNKPLSASMVLEAVAASLGDGGLPNGTDRSTE